MNHDHHSSEFQINGYHFALEQPLSLSSKTNQLRTWGANALLKSVLSIFSLSLEYVAVAWFSLLKVVSQYFGWDSKAMQPIQYQNIYGILR